MEIYITIIKSDFYENAVYLVLRDDDISIRRKISEENIDGRIVVDDELRRSFFEIYAQLCEITKGDAVDDLLYVALTLSYDDFQRLHEKMEEYL